MSTALRPLVGHQLGQRPLHPVGQEASSAHGGGGVAGEGQGGEGLAKGVGDDALRGDEGGAVDDKAQRLEDIPKRVGLVGGGLEGGGGLFAMNKEQLVGRLAVR
jgi:hypothetical protein